MKLEKIGFYTLSDKRARTASSASPLQRCELVLTARCNFRCPFGTMRGNFRQERKDWYDSHDTHSDPICKKNCLDVCVDYNNTFHQINISANHQPVRSYGSI